jgi:hypothetical protein
MQPDERDLLPLPIDADPALDAELAAIDDELVAAGRSIAGDASMPDPSFADALRARLLAAYEAPVDAAPVAGPAPVVGPAPVAAAPDPVRAPSLPPTPIQLADRRPRARLDVRRWSVLAVAAVFVVALVGVGVATQGVAAPGASALAANRATLTRAGATTALSAGAQLAAGDTVTTGEGGTATIAIASGFVRLDADTSLRLDALGAGEIDLSQLAGRAWHRVDVPQGAHYVVATGGVRWTALGTAFDLRLGLPDAPSAIQLVAVVHDVALAGVGAPATVHQGEVATIDPSAAEPAAITPAGAAQTADAWLADNAAADRADGLDAGWLTGPAGSAPATPAPSVAAVVPSPTAESPEPASASPEAPSATPSASASASPTAAPSASTAPTPSPRPTERPTPSPTATPEPTPTPVPTPKPTPTPPPVEPMTLTVTSCDGGVLLNWSPYAGAGFHQYAVLRSASAFDMPATYPPTGDISAVGKSVTTSIGLTSAFDTTLGIGATATYRAGAWNAKGQLIGDSSGHSATRKAAATMDPFTASTTAGVTHVSWTPYTGECFTTYHVTWSATNADVSYLGAHDGTADNSTKAGADANVSMGVGTWFVRVEVIETTDLGSFVVAGTAVQQVTVSP